MKYGILYTDGTEQVIFTKTKLDLTKSIACVTKLHRAKPENSWAMVDEKGVRLAEYYNLEEFNEVSTHTIAALESYGYKLQELNNDKFTQ